MSDIEDKIQKILSDPQSMAQALSMVSSFMGQPSKDVGSGFVNGELPKQQSDFSPQSDEIAAKESVAPSPLEGFDMSGIMGKMLPQLLGSLGVGGNVDKNKMNLLVAVKPFFQEQHQKSIDHALSLVKVAKTAQVAMKTIPKGFGMI